MFCRQQRAESRQHYMAAVVGLWRHAGRRQLRFDYDVVSVLSNVFWRWACDVGCYVTFFAWSSVRGLTMRHHAQRKGPALPTDLVAGTTQCSSLLCLQCAWTSAGALILSVRQ